MLYRGAYNECGSLYLVCLGIQLVFGDVFLLYGVYLVNGI